MGYYPQTPPTASRRESGEGPFAEDIANQLYQHYFSRLLAVATTRYRWLGLGPWIDPMRVEWLLVTQGLCAFTHVRQSKPLPGALTAPDPYQGNRPGVFSDRFTITRAMVTGQLDDTFTPASYQTYAPSGSTGIQFSTLGPLDEWKGVPIWGDANRGYYDQQTIITFARRLATASLVVDTNMKATMRGVVAFIEKQDELLSTQVALSGALRGVDVVSGNPKIIENLKTFDFGVHPDHVERSHVVAMRIWSEALEALGVESPAAEKKERQIVDEVNSNGAQVAAMRRLTLTPRQHAASLINRRYFSGAPVVEVVDQWE